MEDKKIKGKFYTPSHTAKKMVDLLNLGKTINLAKKKILDPACGDGRLLQEIVKCLISLLPRENLSESLHNIHGWDTDKQAIEACKHNLNALVAPLDIKVSWNIHTKDALLQKKSGKCYDLIVANPPYVRIQNLPKSQRKLLLEAYQFCQKGSTDLYLAFFELAWHLLSDKGQAVFISPNSFLNTEAAGKLRAFFQERKAINHIINFKSIRVFEEASTYVAITRFTKGNPVGEFLYEEYFSPKTIKAKKISYDGLCSQTWLLVAGETKGKRLGDIAEVYCGLATLCDKAYILKHLGQGKTPGTLLVSSRLLPHPFEIEKKITKPVIKASQHKNGKSITDRILFPYQKGALGKHQIIQESNLKEKYPLAYAYLGKVRFALDKRDKAKPNPVAWYAFGRSQAVDNGFGEKIIFSPITKSPNFIHIQDTTTTFYSGYAIKYQGDYHQLLDRLNSSRMGTYIQATCRDLRNGYKGINKKIIQEFRLEL